MNTLHKSGLIVVVDDEPAFRTFVDVLLSRSGHRVIAASGVADALAACADRTPDVVLVDMVLPPGNGLSVIAALRRRRPAPKIVAITGGVTWDGSDLLQHAWAAGADVMLRKPVPADVIVSVVENLLA